MSASAPFVSKKPITRFPTGVDGASFVSDGMGGIKAAEGKTLTTVLLSHCELLANVSGPPPSNAPVQWTINRNIAYANEGWSLEDGGIQYPAGLTGIYICRFSGQIQKYGNNRNGRGTFTAKLNTVTLPNAVYSFGENDRILRDNFSHSFHFSPDPSGGLISFELDLLAGNTSNGLLAIGTWSLEVDKLQ